MSTSARKRLMRDFKRLQNDPPASVQAAPLGGIKIIEYMMIVIIRCLVPILSVSTVSPGSIPLRRSAIIKHYSVVYVKDHTLHVN